MTNHFPDPIDLRILAHVQSRARDAMADIARSVGLSISAINSRLKRLESAGVIAGYEARIDPSAVGCDVLAYVFVVVPLDAERAFRSWVALRSEVLECHHVSGEWSYLVKLRTGSLDALEAFLDETKRRKFIARSHSMIRLATVKETARLPIDPGPPAKSGDRRAARGSTRRKKSPAGRA